MDIYKEQLKQHIEKLFRKTQEIVVKRRGEVNRAKHKNFLSYYAKYCQQNKQKSKGKKSYKNDWRDVFNPKPINKGFRDKSNIPIEPTIEQLEQMIEFFERELEKLDGPSDYEIIMKKLQEYYCPTYGTLAGGYKQKSYCYISSKRIGYFWS